MNNKGLTLVELLVVITIIGILLIIAVFKMGNVIEESEKNTFLADAQAVYRTASINAIDLTNISGGGNFNSKGDLKLDLKGKEIDYCIIVNSDAEITSIVVSDGKYIIIGDTNFLSLNSDSISLGNMDSFICE